MIRNTFLTYLEYILGKNVFVFFGPGGSRNYLTLFKRIFKVENQQTIFCVKLSFSRAIYRKNKKFEFHGDAGRKMSLNMPNFLKNVFFDIFSCFHTFICDLRKCFHHFQILH
jgi:hypothetical protein